MLALLVRPSDDLGVATLAVDESVQYVDVRPVGQQLDRSSFKIQVKVGEQEVGDVVEGVKRLNAETIAAWKAVNIIEAVDEAHMTDASEYVDADEGGGVMLDQII